MKGKEQIVLPPQAKESGVTLTPPAGCELEEVNIVDGCVVVTFKAKKQQLPRTWEEFCRTNTIKSSESCICLESDLLEGVIKERAAVNDRNFLPNRETAESVLALCQLIQLRECYNQGWRPNWKDDEKKYVIDFEKCELNIMWFRYCAYSPLYFKSKELRDMFLENFRYLIEKLKPLYGIKEGGEE